MQPGETDKSNNGSWGAQLPLKQLTLLLLFRCYFFLGFFLRCHVDLLTSYVVGFFRANVVCFCTPKILKTLFLCFLFCFQNRFQRLVRQF